MTDEIGLFEAMYTPKGYPLHQAGTPVPDELINRLLEAGVKAPTGGARQMWRFIVIKDEETRNKLGDIYRMGPGSLTTGEMTPQQRRVHRGAQHFREHLQEAPVFISVLHPALQRSCRHWAGRLHISGGAEHPAGRQGPGVGQFAYHEPQAARGRSQGAAGHTRRRGDGSFAAYRLPRRGLPVWADDPQALE